jgi:hypothetical protein
VWQKNVLFFIGEWISREYGKIVWINPHHTVLEYSDYHFLLFITEFITCLLLLLCCWFFLFLLFLLRLLLPNNSELKSANTKSIPAYSFRCIVLVNECEWISYPPRNSNEKVSKLAFIKYSPTIPNNMQMNCKKMKVELYSSHGNKYDSKSQLLWPYFLFQNPQLMKGECCNLCL